jgi:hypothetical protein
MAIAIRRIKKNRFFMTWIFVEIYIILGDILEAIQHKNKRPLHNGMAFKKYVLD